MSPEKLVAQLSEAFHQDRWVQPDARSISVSIDDRQIRLTGSVETLAAKRRAVILAGLVPGKVAVVDRLRRRTAESAGDGELLRQAAERLYHAPAFRDYGLRVLTGDRQEIYRKAGQGGNAFTLTVDDGAITLEGTVGSLSHQRLAEVLIWWLPACQLVDNRLDVSPPQTDSDEEINDAVRMVLELDPMIDAGQVHTQTAAGIVRIEGLVVNASQRRRMLEDTWAVRGIWDVDDVTETRD